MADTTQEKQKKSKKQENEMQSELDWLEQVAWTADGLVPVIAQEVETGDVMMFAWMNREALQETARLKRAVYYSRSRKKLWYKGEESGNHQEVHEIRLDCDYDVVLLKITQHGHDPSIACHTGRHSCFYFRLDDAQKEAPATGRHWKAVEPVLKNPKDIYK